MSGMTAALEASKTGYKVVLLEKSGSLGGMAGKLWKRIPIASPSRPSMRPAAWLTWSPRSMPMTNIKVYLNAVNRQDRRLARPVQGRYRGRTGPTVTEDIGAIIQATGFTPYDMKQAAPSRWRSGQRGRPARAANGPTSDRSGGSQVRGVRPVRRRARPEHLPYCSGHCCLASSKQAMYFKDANPDVDTVVLYTDLRMPGNKRGLLPRRPEQGRDLLQGRGVQCFRQRQRLRTVKFQGPDLNEETSAEDRSGRPGHRHGADYRPRPRPAQRSQPRSGRRRPGRQGTGHPDDVQVGPEPGLPSGSGRCRSSSTASTTATSSASRTKPAARHLCRRPGSPSDGYRPGHGRCHWRHHEGDPGDGERRARQGSASPFRRPVVPDRPPGRLHPVQALHGGVPVRSYRRGRKGQPPAQPHDEGILFVSWKSLPLELDKLIPSFGVLSGFLKYVFLQWSHRCLKRKGYRDNFHSWSTFRSIVVRRRTGLRRT